MQRHPVLLSFLSVLVLAGSLGFSWKRHFATPPHNVVLHEAVGAALAEEVAGTLKNTGEIVVITLVDGASPILASQFTAFRTALEMRGGLRIGKVVLIEADKQAKYGPGSGLSAGKLARELQKCPNASAVVSLVGLPSLDESEVKALGGTLPPLFGLCRDRKKLESLWRNRLVCVAIVPRFQFPAPGPAEPRRPRELFDRQFQVVTGPQGIPE